MRFGVISCVHANLPALEAVLADADQQACQRLVFLGDVVGYYDHPKECLELVRSRCHACVKGNHDEYCSTSHPLEGFNPAAAASVEWTRGELSPVDKTWLKDLPYTQNVDDFIIVHAGLERPELWGYIFDRLAAAAHFAHQSLDLCFNGHTHVPVLFRRDKGGVKTGTYSRFTLEPGVKYLVNVGSVGQPRDGRPEAAYVVYDSDSQIVELRRVDYPRPPSGGHGVGKPVPGTGGPPKTLRAQEDAVDDGSNTQ